MPSYPSCQWCHNRPGGCLYCVNDLEGPEAKLSALNDMFAVGDIHEVAIKYNHLGRPSSVLVRQVHPEAHQARAARQFNAMVQTRSHRGGDSLSPQLPCIDHHWEFDPANLKRRHCTKCPCVQVFTWLPNSPDVQGEWLSLGRAASPAADETAPVEQSKRLKPKASRPKPKKL